MTSVYCWPDLDSRWPLVKISVLHSKFQIFYPLDFNLYVFCCVKIVAQNDFVLSFSLCLSQVVDSHGAFIFFVKHSVAKPCKNEIPSSLY